MRYLSEDLEATGQDDEAPSRSAQVGAELVRAPWQGRASNGNEVRTKSTIIPVIQSAWRSTLRSWRPFPVGSRNGWLDSKRSRTSASSKLL